MKEDRSLLNKELAQMLKGGVIMDVTTPKQAKIAEEAGACAVMALEKIPADIRAAGGVSRMSDPKMIRGIQEAVSIPVMRQFPFPSWQSVVSVILWRRSFWKRLKSITLMRVRFYLLRMMSIT